MEFFSSLKREQKEAVALLQIGTFLEYFDLMLYIHMAVLLNEIFFPKTDPHTASLLAAFAFCSTYILRPFGALIFGWLGDNIGRKTTVILTTLLMSLSCIMMANLPTYAQIGIAAAWFMTLCRVFQGFSSLGEIIGAEIYLTEITKPPVRYPVVAFISIFSDVGSTVALALAFLVTSSHFLNWRMAFWVGALIAVIGTIARTRLRETPEFVDKKKKLERAIKEAEGSGLGAAANLLQKTTKKIQEEKARIKTSLAYFTIVCAWPMCFYFSFIYCGDLLKNTFSLKPEQVIAQNLRLSLCTLVASAFYAYLSYYIHPLKILKVKAAVFSVFIIFLPYFLSLIQTPFQLFFIQLFVMVFGLSGDPAYACFFVHFPVFKRFTYSSFLYALSRSFMYAITSFGLIFLKEFWGHPGLLFIMIPIAIGYGWGILHFWQLEKAKMSL